MRDPTIISYDIRDIVMKRLNALSQVTEDIIHAQYQAAIREALVSEQAARQALKGKLGALRAAVARAIEGRVPEKRFSMVDTAKMDAIFRSLDDFDEPR